MMEYHGIDELSEAVKRLNLNSESKKD